MITQHVGKKQGKGQTIEKKVITLIIKYNGDSCKILHCGAAITVH